MGLKIPSHFPYVVGQPRDGARQGDRMKKLRVGLAGVAASVFSVLLWVSAPVTSAEATLMLYWSGYTIQNQTKFSATAHMIGGEASIPGGGLFPTVRITVAGHGSSEGPASATIGGFSLTTYQYCQWRWGAPDPGSYKLSCLYRY